ncbi:MAG: hypothetical protein AAB897_03180 [Patescibacteria group bacterium]
MTKKIIIIGFVLIAAAAIGVFLLFGKEDPLVAKAKEEIRATEAVLASFQNTVNAIPALELSQDVKNDFKMQANFFGLLGSVTGDEDTSPSPAVEDYASKFISANEARGSAKLSFDLEGGLEKPLKDALLIADVTREDLGISEKAANTFDEAVKQAKAGIPALTPLTVERNKKTEKYFLEFDRINQKLGATAASLNGYSSADFRSKIKKLKSANEIFGETVKYSYQLIVGKARSYPLEIAKTFPEAAKEEAAVKNCAKYDPGVAPVGCEPVAFMPSQFQPLLMKLADIYSGLIE